MKFRDSGGNFKYLRKLIVTSSAYRQTSSPNSDFEKIDANNRTLWRMNRRRLEAELRDAILTTSGALNETLGGPGFYLCSRRPPTRRTTNTTNLIPPTPRATAAPCTGLSSVLSPTLS